MRPLLAGILLFLSLVAFAQTGTISGRILDNDTKEGLIGATVIVEGTSTGGITDLDGNFLIKNVPAGSQRLRIKYVGYDDAVVTVTVQADQTTKAPDILLSSASIGLTEIEVFASVVDDRKTPVAISSIGSVMINEQLGGMQLPELLNSTPGVYATQGDGAFGDAYINIRGFGQEEVLFMINGVPINDMETGIMYWSNFAGLSEVTRNMQVQRGLGASRLAVNAVGGIVNIVTEPSDRRKGGRAETIFGNGSYRNRYRLTLNSGQLKGGWAFTFQGSRSNGEGIRPGTYVDAWSYFLTASKEINSKHSLLFTVFGAPTDRGRAWNTNTPTYEKYGSFMYNEAWGYYNGEKLSVSQNKSHKPQFTLLHVWSINDRLTFTTSPYVSIARVYGTAPLSIGARPGITTEGIQNLEAMRSQNLANVQTITNPYGSPLGTSVTGAQSRHILEARYNNHNWYGVISNLTYQINPLTTIVGGVDLRDYTAVHYGQVHHLLGGEFWVDKDVSGNFDNNLLTPNRIARKGDKIRYSYDGNVRWGSVFGQFEKTMGQTDIFVSANVSRIQMWREGNFWNGDEARGYMYNSLGSSDKRIFNNYNLKAGVNYRITGRHNVFANAGMITRAPFFRNAFVDARFSNAFLEGLKNETIQAVEGGYSYRTSKLKVNTNVYYTTWKDKALVNAAFVDPQTGDRQALNGLAAIHKGIEVDGRYELISGIELTGMVSVGDWRWTNDARAVFTTDQGTEVEFARVFVDGLKVGNSSQTTAFIGAHVKRIRDVYFGFRFNYFGDLYERFDPAERITGYRPVRKLPDYHILDIYGGYYFPMGEMRARVGFNVHNLLNDNFIRRSDELFGVQEAYGFPINFNVNLTVYF
jgi:iron complex outermembrane recepter protein